MGKRTAFERALDSAKSKMTVAENRVNQASRKRDAERYRWLREKHDDGDEQWFVYGAAGSLDESIDAAMGNESGNV